MRPLDVMGPGEVAQHCGVHITTVLRWRQSGLLPEPDTTLAMGPVWRAGRVRAWWLRQQQQERGVRSAGKGKP